MNTRKKGAVKIFIYPEKDKYIAVCLDLDIIEEGKDPQKLIESVKEGVEAYVEAVCKEGLDSKLLDRKAPKKYWNNYYKYLEYFEKPKPLNYQSPYNFKQVLLVNEPVNVPQVCLS